MERKKHKNFKVMEMDKYILYHRMEYYIAMKINKPLHTSTEKTSYKMLNSQT